MIKIFFATFFIAELIIAFAVIAKIQQLNGYVDELNSLVVNNKHKIKLYLNDFKNFLKEIEMNIQSIKQFIHKKQQAYLMGALKTIIIYLSIFLLNGKYKKTVLAYQVISEVYDGLKSFDV